MLPFCAECLTPGYVEDFTVATSSYFPHKAFQDLDKAVYLERNIYCSNCLSNSIVEVGVVHPKYPFPLTRFEIPPDIRPKTTREFTDLVKTYLNSGYVLVKGSDVLDDLVKTLILLNIENSPDSPIEVNEKKDYFRGPENTKYLAFCPKCHQEPVITIKGTKRVNFLKETTSIKIQDIDVKCPLCDTEPICFRISPKDENYLKSFEQTELLLESIEGPLQVKFLPMGNSYYSIADRYPQNFDESELSRSIELILKKINKRDAALLSPDEIITK
ncbi:MAG: hypothetical protein QXT86_08545 [Archaeoglobaceae archaeon]